MLVAGVLLGLLLGPTVLGRFAPQWYDPLFVGSGDQTAVQEAQAEITAFQGTNAEHLAKVQSIIAQFEALGEDGGESMKVAQAEQLQQLDDLRVAQQQQLEINLATAELEVRARHEAHLDKLLGMATVMLLLVVLLFAAESILSPQRDELEDGRAELPPALSRLVTVRYALAAGWLMLMLAQPVWLQQIDLVFGGLLLAVVLLAGLVPLGKRASTK